MAAGDTPADDPVWSRGRDLTPEERERRAQAVLDRRAAGATTAELQRRFAMTRGDVNNLLGYRRGLGDPRALLEHEAAAAAKLVAAAAAALATTGVASDDPRRMKALRFADVLRVASAGQSDRPDAAAGLLHLADLFQEHGPRLYPAKAIVERPGRVPMTIVGLGHSPVGSPAAACLEG